MYRNICHFHSGSRYKPFPSNNLVQFKNYFIQKNIAGKGWGICALEPRCCTLQSQHKHYLYSNRTMP